MGNKTEGASGKAFSAPRCRIRYGVFEFSERSARPELRASSRRYPRCLLWRAWARRCAPVGLRSAAWKTTTASKVQVCVFSEDGIKVELRAKECGPARRNTAPSSQTCIARDPADPQTRNSRRCTSHRPNPYSITPKDSEKLRGPLHRTSLSSARDRSEERWDKTGKKCINQAVWSL